MDHECEAEDAPAAVEGQSGGVLAPELESLYGPLHATRHILDHLAVTGHRDSGVEQADPLDGGDRRLQSLGTVHEGIDPGHVSGEDGVTAIRTLERSSKRATCPSECPPDRHDPQADGSGLEQFAR